MLYNDLNGYIDVGDKRMLMTLSWWQFLDVSDRISILVTSSGCWCPKLMLKDRGCWWQKWPKPSPTSQTSHQHIRSPTSVTNIDVTIIKLSISYDMTPYNMDCILFYEAYHIIRFSEKRHGLEYKLKTFSLIWSV